MKTELGDDRLRRRTNRSNYGRTARQLRKHVSRARRGEGHDAIGAGHRPSLRWGCIGIRARRNVHRNHRGRAIVHSANGGSVQRAHRRTKSGAEDGVHNQIGGKYGRGIGGIESAGIAHHQRQNRKPLEHGGRVPTKFLGRAQQQDSHHAPGLRQLARYHEAVTAVIALPADDAYALRLGIVREDEVSDR